MKHAQAAIKLLTSICVLCVYVALALWAVNVSILLTDTIRRRLTNKIVIHGEIV